MKFVDSSFEIFVQKDGLDGLYKQIERAARVSYKSEDHITEDSAQRMVNALIKNQHFACLEHGTIYLIMTFDRELADNIIKYMDNPYSKVSFSNTTAINYAYITTNYRVIIENGWKSDLKYMCGPTPHHEKRYTVKFILSAGIGREFTRHRAFSFMQESTRYCNYSKQKFGEELTFVIPQWIYNLQAEEASYSDPCDRSSRAWLMNEHGESLISHLICMDRSASSWWDNLEKAEEDYIYLTTTDEGYKLKPEEARGILPLDIKSELVMTGFASDWIHFFNLRSYIAMTGKPHPDAQILADNLLQVFLDKDYIKYESLYSKTEVETAGTEKRS